MSAVSAGRARSIGLRARLASVSADPLMRSAYSLMLNVVLTSGTGVLFWIVAARLFPAAQVGRDSALISAMLLLSAICQLNLSSGLLRFLPIIKLDPARAVLAAYGLTGVVSALGATGFVLVAPRVASQYRFLVHDLPLALAYIGGTISWSVFALQDSVLTAIRRAEWVPVENGVFGVLKIVALPLLLAAGSLHSVFIAWVIPMVMLLVPVNWAIFRRFIPVRVAPDSELSPVERFGWHGLIRFFAGDYAATIFIQAGTTFVPVVVVALLGSRGGAHFYIPFTIVGAFDMLFVNIAASMTVESSRAQDRLPELVRTTVRRFAWILVGGVIVLLAGAWLILLPYGPAYAQAGAPVLRLLAGASMFRALCNVYSAVCRVEGRTERVLALQAAVFVLTIGLTLGLAPSQGLTGVGEAWLLANVLAAACVAPSLVRVLRPAADGAAARVAGSPADGERFLLITVTQPTPAARFHLEQLVASIGRQGVACDMVLVMRGGVAAHRPLAAPFRIFPVHAPLVIGLSRARNLALNRARRLGLLDGPGIVAFPDDDAAYPDGLLHRVAGLIGPDCAVAAGPYAPAGGEVNHRRFPAGRHQLTPALTMKAISSNNIFMSARAARAIGDFDERLGLGATFGAGEDSDYVLRALAAGYRGVYDAGSVLVHHPYKAGRPLAYYHGNVAVLAIHARAGGTRLLLARRLVTGVLLTVAGRLSRGDYASVLRSALDLTRAGTLPMNEG